MDDVPLEENKVEDSSPIDVDKKDNLDEDENVTAEVFDNTNNLVEEGRETQFQCNNP